MTRSIFQLVVLGTTVLGTAVLMVACHPQSRPAKALAPEVRAAKVRAAKVRTPKAVFIIVDGIPADVLERTETPNLDAISKTGGYARAYTGGVVGGESESPTISAVGYMNLITGTWANKHNVWGNEVKQPNYAYWDIFRIAHEHDASLQTAIFSTWEDNRTKLIGDGLPAAGGTKLDYSFDGFEKNLDRFPHDEQHSHINKIDELVAGEAARYIEQSGPDLSWVYLEYTDTVAHGYGDSPELTNMLQIADGRVGRIWEAIKKRQRSHDEDWLIVVTTDHGRDAQSGKDHGGQSERERTTWVVTNSRKLNNRFGNNTAIVDILPSIVTHLKLSIPPQIASQLDGQSFIE